MLLMLPLLVLKLPRLIMPELTRENTINLLKIKFIMLWVTQDVALLLDLALIHHRNPITDPHLAQLILMNPAAGMITTMEDRILIPYGAHWLVDRILIPYGA